MATIYIMGEIATDDEWAFSAPVSAKSIIQQLSWIPENEPIEVVINSIGGSVFEGIAIYSALKARGVTTKVCGLAASIASVIFCAGKERVICEGSYLMIHNVSSIIAGDAKDLESEAKLVADMTSNIAGIYANVTGKDVAEFIAMMDSETWLNGLDSVALGLATSIDVDAIEVKIAAKAKTLFNKIPGDVMNRIEQTAPLKPVVSDPVDQVLETIERFKAMAHDGFDFMALVKSKATNEQAVQAMHLDLKEKHLEAVAILKATQENLEAAKAEIVALKEANKALVDATPSFSASAADAVKALQNAGEIKLPVAGDVVDHRAVMAAMTDNRQRTAYWQKYVKPTLGAQYQV